jgi:hypothetical protein
VTVEMTESLREAIRSLRRPGAPGAVVHVVSLTKPQAEALLATLPEELTVAATLPTVTGSKVTLYGDGGQRFNAILIDGETRDNAWYDMADGKRLSIDGWVTNWDRIYDETEA